MFQKHWIVSFGLAVTFAAMELFRRNALLLMWEGIAEKKPQKKQKPITIRFKW